MKPNNPFLISGYYSPEFFCDRVQETETIINALNNGRNITLMSPRRMGKTGLISNAFYRIENEHSNIFTFYMDIFPTQTLNDFIQLFANTVLGKLDSVPVKAINRVSKFIKSCRPVVTFDDLSGMPKFSLEVNESVQQSTLTEIFDYLKSSEKRCFIAIDEFQQIAEYPEKGVEALLRSYMQILPNISFIFSGSKQHVMQEMFLSAKRPFYQSTQPMLIGEINRDEYYAFAGRMLSPRYIDERTFNYLYDKFCGHTWYVQVVLNRLYSYNEPIDIKLVDYAVHEIIAEYSYNYQGLLAAYPSGSVRLLKAIAKERYVKEINSGEFISKYKLKAASSVNSAVKKLLDNELVYRSADGYIIYDRFMSLWLAEFF
ncbi:MAG: ATP-binding protein [Bacteroidales bacterium]|nr:ATP-binding protein [Bacteroidales bacterium]